MPRTDPERQIRYLKSHPEVKNIRRYELMQVLVDFAHSTHGPTPSERGLWRIFNSQCTEYGFKRMAYGVFLLHFKKLINEGLVEKKHSVICIVDSEWKPPTNLPDVIIEKPPPRKGKKPQR